MSAFAHIAVSANAELARIGGQMAATRKSNQPVTEMKYEDWARQSYKLFLSIPKDKIQIVGVEMRGRGAGWFQ